MAAADLQPPDPAKSTTLDEIAEYLQNLRAWSGGMSYSELTRRLNARRASVDEVSQTTVYSCFRAGRKRVNVDLVVEIGGVLGLDRSRQTRLRQAAAAASGRVALLSTAEVNETVAPATPHFVGRGAPLRQLVRRLRPAPGSLTAPVAVVCGPAGAGKTQLARRAAEELEAAGRCGDGQLFVDLHGFDPDRRAVEPEAALAGLLRAVGVAEDRIYCLRTLEERAGLWRSTVSGKHLLLVLDNAADYTQIASLLPQTPACAVLATSRRRFAAAGVAEVALPPMSASESVELLRSYDDSGRLDADPDAAADLAVRLCHGSPLELAALGAQLASPDEADWSLADHAARLQAFPPDEVARPALAGSYHSVSPPDQAVFRLLGLLPTNSFTPGDVAALADVDLAAAHASLRKLADLHLLIEPSPDRYGFHDVARAYAGRLVRQLVPITAHQAALERLRDYHRRLAATAMRRYAPFVAAHEPAPAHRLTPEFADWESARTHLLSECDNMVDVAVHAAAHGDLEHACEISQTLAYFLYNTGRFGVASQLHRTAAQSSDPLRQAQALEKLGNCQVAVGHYRQAKRSFTEALEIAEEHHDGALQSRSLCGLGMVGRRHGHAHAAERQLRRAVDLARETGDVYLIGLTLTRLGGMYGALNRFQLSADCYEEALRIAREVGHFDTEAKLLANLAFSAECRGDTAAATSHYLEALELSRRGGLRELEALTLANLGRAYSEAGRHDDAEAGFHAGLHIARDIGAAWEEAIVLGYFGEQRGTVGQVLEAVDLQEQALALARQLDDPGLEGMARVRLGTALRHAGRDAEALRQQRRGLELTQGAGNVRLCAVAHDGIAQTHSALGDGRAAAEHWRRARDIYRDIGLPAADEVAAKLAELESARG